MCNNYTCETLLHILSIYDVVFNNNDYDFPGGVRETAPGEDKQDLIDEAGKQEIPLTLVNKFEGLAQDDSSDMKALFVRYCTLQSNV